MLLHLAAQQKSDHVRPARSSKRREYLPSENQFLWNMTNAERLYAMERASFLSRSVADEPEMSIFGPEGPPMLRTLKESAESARRQRLQMSSAGDNDGRRFPPLNEEEHAEAQPHSSNHDG